MNNSNFRRSFSLVLLISMSGFALAAPTECRDSYASNVAPTILRGAAALGVREVCYKSFAVMHSGLTRTPLWSAEHLTRDRIEAARKMKRDSEFHPDDKIPDRERAELTDYVHSGLDRGHMAPSGDMPDKQSQYESFSLANIIPQNSENNQNLWETIESATRALAMTEQSIYVVTGPVFQAPSPRRLHGEVVVPDMIYKAVYIPSRNAAAAYLVNNASGDRYAVVSIAKLKEITGINPFPFLADSALTAAAVLPPPGQKPNFHNERENAQRPVDSRERFAEMGAKLLRGMLQSKN